MSDLDRRSALKILATGTAAASFGVGDTELRDRVLEAREVAEQAASGVPYTPKFFGSHEWATLRVLADMIIPRDERSGSATDAGAPEYIDFVLADQTPAGKRQAPSNAQTQMRGGLAWLDRECGRRFTKTFVASSESERRQVLDDIAWPEKAKPEFAPGVAFFNRARDMVAAGFFSSKMGVKDLRYLGNTFVTEWKGCPDEVLTKLGVKR